MASNYTEYYGFCQWEATDQVLRTEFNEGNAKVDEALKGLADKEVTFEKIIAGHEEDISKCGNCRIWTSSYIGDGNTSRVHSFSEPPLAVFIAGPAFQLLAIRPNPNAFAMQEGNYWHISTVWSESSLSLTYADSLAGGDYKSGNKSGTTYFMVVLFDAAE